MSDAIRLIEIAAARSGDKGYSANIGVIARTPKAYEYLKTFLTPEKVHQYFRELNPKKTDRYEMPGIMGLNFVLEGILDGGGSRSLRVDAQGKALGQALLLMELPIKPEELEIMKET